MDEQELIGSRQLCFDSSGLLEPLFSASKGRLEARFAKNSLGALQLVFPNGKHALDEFSWQITRGSTPFKQQLKEWNAIPALTLVDRIRASGWVYAKGTGQLNGALHDVYLVGRPRNSSTDVSSFAIVACGAGGVHIAHKHDGAAHDDP